MTDYKITGSPETIWLNYGDIDRDDTHKNCARDGEVTWCDEAVFYSDIKYVRADIAQAREAELVAHVERLKRALEMPCDRWSKKQHEIVKEVLESTPAQSLSRLRNEVLEEAATDGCACRGKQMQGDF